MKKRFSKLCCIIIVVMLLTSSLTAFAQSNKNVLVQSEDFNIPLGLEVNWNERHTLEQFDELIDKLVGKYPEFTEKYSIGTSYQERDLWCLEITNEKKKNEKKIGIGVFANIHGGEQESAESAMYTAWWLLLNSSDDYIKDILDNYIIYVVPVINPDGYMQSFVYNNRQNLRPTDRNNDGIPFSDPYTDINGDGFIAKIYKGTIDGKIGSSIGMESSDWDNNGRLGDDPRSSMIDLNRTFDYQWNRFDIEKKNDGIKEIGANAWGNAGPSPASEPEVQAVQNFLYAKPMNALVSIHTGIQCVLYPWCYRDYDETNPRDKDIPFMAETANKMADKYMDSTGRNFYSMSSHEDYSTSAELIDFSYGKLNIHSYTIEVYRGGKSEEGANFIDSCTWNNELPQQTEVFYNKEELKELCLSSDTIDKLELAENEGLWFVNTATAQMSGKAPEDQETMLKGCKDAILIMIESEPYGEGYKLPEYIKWRMLDGE